MTLLLFFITHLLSSIHLTNTKSLLKREKTVIILSVLHGLLHPHILNCHREGTWLLLLVPKQGASETLSYLLL